MHNNFEPTGEEIRSEEMMLIMEEQIFESSNTDNHINLSNDYTYVAMYSEEEASEAARNVFEYEANLLH